MKSEKRISDQQLEQLRAALCRFGLLAERVTNEVVWIKSSNGNFVLKKTNEDAMLAFAKEEMSLSEKNLDLLLGRDEGEYPTKSLFVITK